MALLYKADPARGAEWARLLALKAPDLPFRIWPDFGDPDEIRYLAAWLPPALALLAARAGSSSPLCC